MKMTKKIVSVLLALMLCLGSFAFVIANAATEEAATAEAEAYNALERDFSDVMGNVSYKKAAEYADKLNELIYDTFTNADIKSKIYTNEVATAIIRALADALNTTISNSMKAEGIKENYPEAYEYLFVTCEAKWENIDNSKVNWNITPGDRAAFAKAIGYGSTNFGTTIIFAGAMGEWMGQPDVYTTALLPLIESLHVGTVIPFTEAMALGDAGIVEYVIGKVCDAIDALVADPVNYITDILPDFVRTYPAAADVIVKLVKALLPNGGFSLPTLNELVASLGEKYGLTLSEIDTERLATMGTAKAAISGATGGFRTEINGDKPVVFMAIVDYVKENLEVKDNQYALGRIVVDMTGYASTETYDAMISAVKSGDKLTYLAKLSALAEEISGSIKADSSVPGILRFFARITGFFAKIARFITEFFLGFRR